MSLLLNTCHLLRVPRISCNHGMIGIEDNLPPKGQNPRMDHISGYTWPRKTFSSNYYNAVPPPPQIMIYFALRMASTVHGSVCTTQSTEALKADSETTWMPPGKSAAGHLSTALSGVGATSIAAPPFPPSDFTIAGQLWYCWSNLWRHPGSQTFERTCLCRSRLSDYRQPSP